MPMPSGFVHPKVAREYYGVSQKTLENWRAKGTIPWIRPGRNYKYLIIASEGIEVSPKSNFIYARVSTQKQKGDLNRQISYLQDHYPEHQLITDIGSGLNFKRKGLKKILECADSETLGEVVVAHQDRLSRFGFELLRWFIERKGGKIMVLNREESSPEEELVKDLLSIITVFSARVHGLRSYHRAIKKDSAVPHTKTKENTQGMARDVSVVLQPNSRVGSRYREVLLL